MTTTRTLVATLGAVVLLLLSTLAGPAPVAGTATPTPLAACASEDGSDPGQAFPCAWTGGANGVGRRYVLTMPVCSTEEVAASDAAHRAGRTLALPCEDMETLTGSWS